MSIDNAQERFKEIAAEVAKNLTQIKSEQDARFQIINRVITEVLGWPMEDVETEPHTKAGYVDYVLKAGGQSKLVIEAKRTANQLVDTANPKVRAYRLEGASLKSSADGIQQARDYCVERGTPYAALTNGLAWVVFQAYRSDGRPSSDTKAIVFPNLGAVTGEFALFYDLLSKEGVSLKSNMIQLAKYEGLRLEREEELFTPVDLKRIAREKKGEMTLALEGIFDEFFTEMTGDKDPEMLSECFVETKESAEADRALEKLTREFLDEIETLATDTASQLREEIEMALETKRGESVVIVGNKGAGKSTFIERFFKRSLDRKLRAKCLVITIDLRDSTGDEKSIAAWLTQRTKEEIEKSLYREQTPSYDELRGIFFSEYQRWSKGEMSHLYETDRNQFKIEFGRHLLHLKDKEPQLYVTNLVKHAIRSRKLMPCIVFDNADHYPQTFQDAVFQYAQALHRSAPSVVITPITDRTTWQLSKSGALQSYMTKSFFLPVPPTKQIFGKRIEFLKRKIEAEGTNAGRFFTRKGIRVEIRDIKAFAACLEEIFVNSHLMASNLATLANYDIRRTLRIAHRIITSPVLGVEELIKAYVTQTTFRPNERRLVRALLYGPYNYYNADENEFVLNLFSIARSDVTSPLVKIRILRFLRDTARQATDTSEAYREIAEIETYFEPMGVSARTVQLACNLLLKRRLVESYDPTQDEVFATQRIAIAPTGEMHLTLALENLIYIDQMALITPTRERKLATEIYSTQAGKGPNAEKWRQVENMFIRYCIKQDRQFVTVPKDSNYDGQRNIVGDLANRFVIGAI